MAAANTEVPVVDDPIAPELPVSRRRVESLLKDAFPDNVPSFGEVRRIDPNQGFLSIILSIDLQWHDARKPSGPSSIVMKLPTIHKFGDVLEGMTGQGDGNMTDVFDKDSQSLMIKTVHNVECQAYKILQDNTTGLPSVAMPRLYVAKPITDADTEGALVIDDLSKECGTAPDLIDGMSIAQLEGVCEQLSRLQAFAIRSNAWRGLWKEHPMKDMFEKFAGMIRPMYAMLEQWSHVFPYKLEDVEHLFDFEKMKEMMEKQTLNEDSCVIVHGDLWMNNVLCAEKGRGPTAAIIDWQLAHMGRPGEDFARILSVSASTDVRRNNDIGLLKRHYARVTELLGQAPPFTYEELIEDYEAHLVPQCAFVGGFAAFIVGENGPLGHETQERKEAMMRKAADCTRDALAIWERTNKEKKSSFMVDKK